MHRNALRQQLKEGGIDLHKIRKTNLAMMHRRIWDKDEGIEEEDETIVIDEPSRWIPVPKYMRTDEDHIGYDSMDEEEFGDHFLEQMQQENTEEAMKIYLKQQREETRDKYYNYKYQAPNGVDAAPPSYLFSLLLCVVITVPQQMHNI